MKILTINSKKGPKSDHFSDNYQEGSYQILANGPWGVLQLGYKLNDEKTGLDILLLLEKLAKQTQVSNMIPNKIVLLVNERGIYEKMDEIVRSIYSDSSSKSNSSSSNSSC